MAGYAKNLSIVLTNHPITTASEVLKPNIFITDIEELQKYDQPQFYTLLSSVLPALPVKIYRTYCSRKLYFDDFLWCLKLNIIRILCADKVNEKISKKITPANSCILQCSENTPIPNLETYRFYQLILQTGFNAEFDMSLKYN